MLSDCLTEDTNDYILNNKVVNLNFVYVLFVKRRVYEIHMINYAFATPHYHVSSLLSQILNGVI